MNTPILTGIADEAAHDIDGQIKVLQREVASLDPDAEPEAYSERFAELIALERQRRDVRSEE